MQPFQRLAYSAHTIVSVFLCACVCMCVLMYVCRRFGWVYPDPTEEDEHVSPLAAEVAQAK